MARVVQRRGTPPYILILLVFLFLVSTTLAVLFYVRYSDSTDELADEQDNASALRIEKGQSDKAVARLAMKIAGRAVTADAAMEEADVNLQLEHVRDLANLGLSSAIKELNGRVSDGLRRNADLEANVTELRDVIAGKDEAILKVRRELMNELKKVQEDLVAAENRLGQGLAEKDDQLKRAVAEYKTLIERKDQRITALAADVESKFLQIQQRDIRIDELLRIIADLRGRAADAGDLVLRKPDGKIARAFIEQGICYISLGENDRVTPGLSFGVYSAQTGIPKEGKSKAKIVVTNVFPTTSECRIVKQSRTDPIMEGDLIANVVFDTTRAHTFVIEGEFDLYGQGRLDPLSASRVRAMIEEFGGRVMDTVTISTDFVVIGEEPPRPPKPAEDAAPAAWRIYNEKMKVYQHYKEVQAVAISLRIPVLNTTRFLAFSGYMPKKRLAVEK